jgi:small subunit ribosomal protein S4e
MARNHLKRIAVGRKWPVSRKTTKYMAKPRAGAHSLELGLPLVVVLRDILGLARTRHEARDILNHKEVLIDGIKRSDHRYVVGFMDVISIPALKKSYRIVINTGGKLAVVDAGDSSLKVERIKRKFSVKGAKVLVTLDDGRNLPAGKEQFKVGDSLLIEVPSCSIKSHFKFEKKACVLMTGGKHIGKVGVIESIDGGRLVFRDAKNNILETKAEHAYVIGKESPAVKMS